MCIRRSRVIICKDCQVAVEWLMYLARGQDGAMDTALLYLCRLTLCNRCNKLTVGLVTRNRREKRCAVVDRPYSLLDITEVLWKYKVCTCIPDTEKVYYITINSIYFSSLHLPPRGSVPARNIVPSDGLHASGKSVNFRR